MEQRDRQWLVRVTVRDGIRVGAARQPVAAIGRVEGGGGGDGVGTYESEKGASVHAQVRVRVLVGMGVAGEGVGWDGGRRLC